jgi:hypothetical protein
MQRSENQGRCWHFGKLPGFFKDEAELRAIWSAPDTRKKLLQGLAEKGFSHEQLAEMQKIIDAEKSDLFDVLAHVAYAMAPLTREERASRAWDFLSIALSVVTADLAGHRDRSPDGWTRELDLEIAVADPMFWTSQLASLTKLLEFLTTDRWQLRFIENGLQPIPDRDAMLPEEDCVVLLSGGLDSFVGAIDLSRDGRRPFAVSQSVRGDDEKQAELAALIGNLSHLRLNHNAHVPDPEGIPSQRSRSIIFLAYGILAATSLARYHAGDTITLNICENGFISINPPLTSARLGSLSTRTSHPVVFATLQGIVDAAGLRVHFVNPYQHKTKGEMLTEGRDQPLLLAHAHRTTSCGRFKRYGYKHCGRCVPCLIRRAAFTRWGVADQTEYKYQDLSPDDESHARSDDVRAAAMAIVDVQQNGLDAWLGTSLSSPLVHDRGSLRGVVMRGLDEIEQFLKIYRIQ